MTFRSESDARGSLIGAARAIAARGLSHGSTGNVSVRFGNTIVITPTRSSMTTVTESELALLDENGLALRGSTPSKEAPLHRAVYSQRPSAGAVVHTHSTFATAVSCLADIDPADAMPALTAYYAMRIERLPVVDFYPPGDPALAESVGAIARDSPVMLLRNHGVVVSAATVDAAVEIAEEIERTAEIFLLLADKPVVTIPRDERTTLNQKY